MSLYRLLLSAALGVGLLAAPALAGPPRGQDRAQQRMPDRVQQDRAPQDRPQQDRPQQDRPMPSARDQDRAFQATRDGRSMPLPKLERRVMPFMGGADYLGPEFNGGTYRLKFMQNGHVIWVDVDAATGRIIRRSQP